MKYLSVLAMAVAITVQLCSCSGIGGGDSATVVLPDTTKMPKARPVVDGNIGKYIRIVPERYEFVFNDSISQVDVLLKLKKQYESTGFSSVFISNGDSLLAEVPYLQLIDDMNKPMPVVLTMDSTKVVRIRSLLRGDLDAEIELRFTGPVVSEEMRDSIKDFAANFKLVANYTDKVDSKKIDRYIDDFEECIKVHNTYALPGKMPDNDRRISEYRTDENRLSDARTRVRRVYRMMNDEQKARYNAIARSEKKVKVKDPAKEKEEAEKETKADNTKAGNTKAESPQEPTPKE